MSVYRPLEGQGSSPTEGYTVQGEECVGGRETGGKREGNEEERDEG